jgi:energy-coupling factor transport system ATP-binding protein
VADDPIIAFSGLSVTYPGASSPALDRLELAIAAGEYVGIVGLNGAGKTTLGLTLNGIVPHLLPATLTGSVTVAGNDPSAMAVREMARSVGIIFDNPEYQLSQPTVADEVAFGLESLGVAPDAMSPLIDAALGATGLRGLEDRSPISLSGGQQQRLAIAAVLVMEPAILFMDEPTSNLDPAGSAEVIDLSRRLNVERGMTVVIAEHDVEALATHADRIVVLADGRVVMHGPTAEILGRVDDLERLGLRAPQVTSFAHALAPAATDLPLTVPEAVRWLEARS